MFTVVFISTILWGCSSQLWLQKKTENLIEKYQNIADTIYVYSTALNDCNIVWYHKDNLMHCFSIKPHTTKQHKIIEAKDIILDNEIIEKYFENFLFKETKCFESVLDGDWIKIYIKDKEPLFSSIDTECLFSTKFKANSFPYKLQYDLFKLGISPIGFNFENMYFE